jgi:hypothetical protein
MLGEILFILLTLFFWCYLEPGNPHRMLFLPIGSLLLAALTIFNLWGIAWILQAIRILLSPSLFYVLFYANSEGYETLFGQHHILLFLFLIFVAVLLLELKVGAFGLLYC